MKFHSKRILTALTAAAVLLSLPRFTPRRAAS